MLWSEANDMSFITYKSYSFIDKDPIIDRMRTIVRDSGVSYKEIRNRSGVTVGCVRGWFDGETRRPMHATVAAVAQCLGYDLMLVSRKKGKRK